MLHINFGLKSATHIFVEKKAKRAIWSGWLVCIIWRNAHFRGVKMEGKLSHMHRHMPWSADLSSPMDFRSCFGKWRWSLTGPWDALRHGLIGGLEHESHLECRPKSNLVGGVEHFFIFPYIGNVIIPTDEFIFFRGVDTTNQWCFSVFFDVFCLWDPNFEPELMICRRFRRYERKITTVT